MARRRGRRRLIVPAAHEELRTFKGQVMQRAGYRVNPSAPDAVKYEVARSFGIPLRQQYNGKLTTEDAGKIGGEIGGKMVREMIRMAQQQLMQQQKP